MARRLLTTGCRGRATSTRAARGWFGAARVVLCLVLGTACSINPQSGRREVIIMSEESEQEVDEEQARLIEMEMGLVDDPKLSAYVDRLGQELAAHSLRTGTHYVFSIVEMDEPNAFALPGGHIYVSRGLLLLANSEAELANVLGHEIGHVAARHAAQRATRGAAYTVGSLLLAVAAAVAGAPEAAVGIGSFLTMGGPQQALAAYSREQESEADRLGQTMAAETGIDPAGMGRFLDALDDYTRLHLGASRTPSWFDTHPATPERVAETTTRAQVLRWVPGFGIARTREAFLEKLDGLSIGRPASEGVLRDGRLLHPDLRISVRFPPGWTIANQHSRVIAEAPSGDAWVLLELQGPGDDPRAGAAADADRLGLRFQQANPVKIGPLPGFRARTEVAGSGGTATAEITWIAFEGNLYRLSGMAPRASFGKYEGTFRAFARGFRELEPSELAGIDELRLRLARAREGELLPAFGARVGNEWDTLTTAVANRIQLDSPLREGQLLKIARREPYRPPPRGTTPAPASEASGPSEPAG